MLRRRTRLVHTKVLVLVELLLKAEFLSKSVSRGVAYYSCTRRGKEFLEAYERLQALTVSAGLYEFGVF
jgi:predicted transcriptional regulator